MADGLLCSKVLHPQLTCDYRSQLEGNAFQTTHILGLGRKKLCDDTSFESESTSPAFLGLLLDRLSCV